MGNLHKNDVRFVFTYLQLFVGEFMSYLRYLCLLVNSGVQHSLCWVFISVVYPMLPVSLDCPLLIAPSVFSNFCCNNT